MGPEAEVTSLRPWEGRSPGSFLCHPGATLAAGEPEGGLPSATAALGARVCHVGRRGHPRFCLPCPRCCPASSRGGEVVSSLATWLCQDWLTARETCYPPVVPLCHRCRGAGGGGALGKAGAGGACGATAQAPREALGDAEVTGKPPAFTWVLFSRRRQYSCWEDHEFQSSLRDSARP